MEKNKAVHVLFIITTLLALTFGAVGVVTPAQAANTNSSAFATLGVYPATATTLNGDTTVTPSAAPGGATSLVAYTSTDFKGTFAVNAAGVVTVTNPHPAGVYTVTVKAYGTPNATSTFALTVNTGTICAGTCSFTNAADVSMGSNNPNSIAIGDFNQDGKQDIATTSNTANMVSIRLGDGLGGFSSATDVGVGIKPLSIAIGDFNQDGKQDFVTANQTASTASIRLGDGLGGFSGTTNVSVGAAVFVAIGDFNGDGKQDFATANGSANTVSIRLGDGLGGFSSAADISLLGMGPYSIAVGDFNQDGKQDVAIDNYNANTVSIRLGDGLGGFSGATNISVGTGPLSVAIGDFNHDGKQDFATTNSTASTVSIRLGDGLGGFSGTTNVSVGASPYSVALGDFNQDGKQDFASANGSSNSVSIRLGDGLGGFSGTTNVNVGTLPFSVAIGDFDHDGTPDFTTANYSAGTASIRLGVCLYTVIFNANGGSGSMAAQVASVATNLTVNSFTRAGYTFTGWTTAADGSGTAYANGASYPFTADITLYAQWLANATATATVTNTPIPPTATATATETPIPPTATATATETLVPPTATVTATETPIPPTATATATDTPVPPTATATATETPVPPTATATPTNTPVPPTATATATDTPVPPTVTATPTPTATANLTPVTVTINQATGQTDPTNTRLLSFTATFSEAVSGFTSTDVSVALSATCAPVVTVTGSGAIYNVALAGMTRECIATVSIPAGVVNSISRPAAVNAASTSSDNSQGFKYLMKVYYSLGANDGAVLESAVGSNVGGTLNTTNTTMGIGDDASNRRYRIFSRFSTSTDPVPASASIAVINYRVKHASISGINPLGTHGNLITELNVPYFGTSANLELIDFQSAADQSACNFDTTLLADNAYRCVFFNVALALFPKSGVLDVRSRFATSDTNNTADLLTIYSGNISNQSLRPQLFVSYYFLP